jgi:hypothetical protein
MEESDQFLNLINCQQSEKWFEDENVGDVQKLVEHVTKNKKERKFPEVVLFYNRFLTRLLQDLSCCKNACPDQIQKSLEKPFAPIEKESYENFIQKADEKWINEISLSAISWAEQLNTKNMLPNPNWLGQLQHKIEFYPEVQWKALRSQAVEEIKKTFEE